MAEQQPTVKNYVLTLTNGQQFTFQMENFEPLAFAQSMNNERVTVVTIGDIVFHRQMFGTLIPADIAPKPQQ